MKMLRFIYDSYDLDGAKILIGKQPMATLVNFNRDIEKVPPGTNERYAVHPIQNEMVTFVWSTHFFSDAFF